MIGGVIGAVRMVFVRVSRKVFVRVSRKVFVCVAGAVREVFVYVTTVTPCSPSLYLQDGIGRDRTSYMPVHGDSHAFLGAAYATGGRCNSTI
jgi:hypothetical protein